MQSLLCDKILGNKTSGWIRKSRRLPFHIFFGLINLTGDFRAQETFSSLFLAYASRSCSPSIITLGIRASKKMSVSRDFFHDFFFLFIMQMPHVRHKSLVAFFFLGGNKCFKTRACHLNLLLDLSFRSGRHVPNSIQKRLTPFYGSRSSFSSLTFLTCDISNRSRRKRQIASTLAS